MALTKEQLEVINHGKGSILVSASAGSGKTHTMIERVIRLIAQENVNVSEILCVTFTEAAAFDMKEKLQKALAEKIQLDLGDKARLKVQLGEVPTADISTMHAFCGRLIRTYFFAVGVAPDFKILDESDATVLKERCIQKTFKEFYDSGEEWFYTLVDRHALSRSDKKLAELVLSAFAFSNSEAQPQNLMQKSVDLYTKENFYNLHAQFKRAFDKILSSYKQTVEVCLTVFKVAELKSATSFAESLLSDICFMLGAKDFYEIRQFRDYKLPLNFERKLTEEVKEYKEKITGVRDQLIKTIKRFFKCVGESEQDDLIKFNENKIHTEWFLRLVNRFSEIYAQEKQEENALDFNDLEHFALKVLSDEQIRDDVRSKYKYIFVDEYQDTNGVQESIIERIENDNVFMVGDVKQSIYGFRGCRSEFFTHKDSLMSARGDKVVRLNANFRSAKNVVNAVNTIFNYSMTEEFYGENYAGRSELVYGNTFALDADGRFELHFLKKDEAQKKPEEQPRIYDVIQEKPSESEENSAYASLIAKIINGELEKKIYDAKKGEYRQVCFGDIALLTRGINSKNVYQLINGLVRRGIPVSSGAEINVLDYAEIKMLVNALKLIDCFSQDVPLASTLKSPLGKFTEEELMDVALFFKDNGNYGTFVSAYKYYIQNADTPLKDKLLRFDGYIKELRLISDFIGAHGVLEKMINDNNVGGYLSAMSGGQEKVFRLNRFLSASVVGGKNLTVREFLHRIETCSDAFGLSHFASENTVKAMTIHASKGLEFPVVIVCGLERGFNDEDDYKEIMFDREYGFAVKTYDDKSRTKEETLLRGLIREKNRIERMKEELRLFYVATTRATYSLHLVFSAKEDQRKFTFDGAENYVDCIPMVMPVTTHESAEFDFNDVVLGKRKVIIGKADVEQIDEMKKRFSYEYPFLFDTSLPLKHTVTASVKEGEKDFYPVHVLFDEQAPDAERGTIAHKVLELYDFYSDDSLEKQTEKMVDNGLILKDDLIKINLERIDTALKGGAFDALKNAVLYREKPFLVAIEGNKVTDTKSSEKVLLQGVIDLLAVFDDGARIIDYKYSSLDGNSLCLRYKKQLELYSYAVETVLGIKVKERAIINLFTGETVKV